MMKVNLFVGLVLHKTRSKDGFSLESLEKEYLVLWRSACRAVVFKPWIRLCFRRPLCLELSLI